MEVKMKKYLLVCFLMVSMLTVVLPVSLFSQPEDEEEDPVQALPNPLAWKQLEKMEMLKTLKLKEVQNGQVWQFELRNIKLALEKAKVNQKVTILYVNPEGMAYPLGTYSPLKRKSQATLKSPAKLKTTAKPKSPANLKSPTAKGKLKKNLINPQPEPPRFHTIPALKQVPKRMAKKMMDLRWKGKSVLIFKDAAGQIKAVVNLNMGPLPKRVVPIKRR
jgi:hypothetical protein